MKYISINLLIIVSITIVLIGSGKRLTYGEQVQKPNILFITTDYTRGVDLPSYGSPFLEMPNIDRLCKEGAVFTNHISTSPICMPTRYTWVTGQYPHTHGMWDNNRYSIKSDAPMLIREFKNLGYQTLGIGKMHFSPWDAGSYYYDVRIIHEGQDLGNHLDDDYNKFLKKHGLDRDKIRDVQGPFNLKGGNSVYDWPFDEELHHDNFVADQTLRIIHEDRLSQNDPWFMWISFSGPHNPWNPPKRYAEPYRNMKNLPLGDFREDNELREKPIEYTRHRYGYGGNVFELYDAMSDEEKEKLRRYIRAAHYGSLTMIDERIGDILAELRDRRQLDNTIIIFTSDHGSALFDNNMLHKGAHFDTQVRVPFIVWWPDRIKPGVRSNISSHVDLFPTIMQLTGGKMPKILEGKSLVPMLENPLAKVQDFAVVECTFVTSIISDKWRIGFHHYNNEIDLYDVQKDPHSFYNLAEKPEYASVINQLQKQLVEWRQALSPTMDIPEDPLKWRECLGPQDIVSRFREGYLKQYRRLSTLDESKRPGKVGKYVKKYLPEDTSVLE